MLFTNCVREQNVNNSINNCEIDMVYKTKFLGVVIDSKLTCQAEYLARYYSFPCFFHTYPIVEKCGETRTV